MADKLFKDYFNERQEDNAIQGNTKILIKRGNNVRKIDVDKFATAAQGSLADSAVQPSALGTMAYEDADDYVDLTSNQNISGVKTFNDRANLDSLLLNGSDFIEIRTISGTSVNVGARIRPNNQGGFDIGSDGGINSYIHNLNSNGDTIFSTRSGTDKQRVRITGFSGNVSFYNEAGTSVGMLWKTSNESLGIGTTSPSDKLTVQTVAGAFNGITLKDSGGNDAAKFNINPSTGEIRIGSSRNNYFPTFYSNNNEVMRISTSGNVGIGTTSPTAKLDVNGNTKITGTLDLNDGSNSVIIGTNADASNDSVAVGRQAGLLSTGQRSVYMGRLAGYQAQGVNQVAIGYDAGRNNTNNNTVNVGYESGENNIAGNQTAVGYQSGQSNTGINQSAFGYWAGRDNIGGNQSAFGYLAGRGNIGVSQSAFGYFAGESNTGVNQSAFGKDAGYLNTGANQSAFGLFAGRENTGINQSAFGRNAGYLNTGSDQSAFGYFAGRENTGSRQLAFGLFAGRGNIGNNNIAIGFESSYQNQGDDVLSIGNQAGKSNTQSNRTIIDNDLLPAFASFGLAEAAFGTGQAGMTYLYFNTITNAIEGVRF